VTCALGLLAFALSRQAIMTIAVAFVGKWARSALVNWSMLLLGLVWLIGAIFTETYYREGAARNRLPSRFGRVTAIELGIAILGFLIVTLVPV
jgi:hypothetical protein